MAMNKKTRLETFDVAEHLRTPDEMAAYLDACIIESDGDAAFIAKALGDIARAQGMSKVARDAGLSRDPDDQLGALPARGRRAFAPRGTTSGVATSTPH